MQGLTRSHRSPRFHVIGCRVLWREICYVAAQGAADVAFTWLDQALHDTPDQLRVAIQTAIDDTVGAGHEALLLAYGLCSNAIVGVHARDTRLVVPRAHDCITLLLGSARRYTEYFAAHPGTYWYTPGWIDTGAQPGRERIARTRAAYARAYGEDNADYLMDMEQRWLHEYDTAAYVDLAIGDSSERERYTRRCAEELGWRYTRLTGDAGLVRRFVDARWEADEFLVVEPGQTIRATHDDRIVDAVCSEDST